MLASDLTVWLELCGNAEQEPVWAFAKAASSANNLVVYFWRGTVGFVYRARQLRYSPC